MNFLDLKPELVVAYTGQTITFCTVLFLYVQVRLFSRQLKLESLIRLKENNREILALGFDHPELFNVLNGKDVEPEMEKRYLQLWLNQMDIVWHAQHTGLLFRQDAEALRKDTADFFMLPSMQKHWILVRGYYPSGFQVYIDGIIRNVVSRAAEPTKRGGYIPASRSRYRIKDATQRVTTGRSGRAKRRNERSFSTSKPNDDFASQQDSVACGRLPTSHS